MKFVTMFSDAENIHLTKDVGMIPFIMYKEFGYESTIVCYKNGEYPYLENEVKGVNIDFIKRYTGKSIIDGSIYLLKNAKKIDILQLFHLSKKSYLWICIYKMLNRNGKIYLKLDTGRTIKNTNFKNKNLKNRIRKFVLCKCKLISVETKELYEYINKNLPVKVELIPNGFNNNHKIQPIMIEEKENFIITVGRIGSKEKANEILMEAFAKVHNEIIDWKVKFIGPIEDEFKSYIDQYYNKYPMLKDRVIFTGAIYDKEKLDEEYRKAKIFCLTSLSESFGIVLVEAIKNGCYIISSDVPAACDITEHEKFGDIFNVGNVEKLSYLLVNNCKNHVKLNNLCGQIQNFAYDNFDWKIICEKIYVFLN